MAGLGGFIGFDFAALRTILDAHRIPPSEWIFLLDKMGVLTKVGRRYWNPPDNAK